MVIDFLLASEEEVSPSSPHNERSITMANFLPSSVGRGGGGHVSFSIEEEVCASSPKKDRVITMVTFPLPQ